MFWAVIGRLIQTEETANHTTGTDLFVLTDRNQMVIFCIIYYLKKKIFTKNVHYLWFFWLY